jgi:hypothetical protein
MPKRPPSLAYQIRCRIKQAEMEWEHARTAEERDDLSKEIHRLTTRERQVRADQRRKAALKRR